MQLITLTLETDVDGYIPDSSVENPCHRRDARRLHQKQPAVDWEGRFGSIWSRNPLFAQGTHRLEKNNLHDLD